MSGDGAQEILLADLHPHDTLVLETERSVYTFTITDRSNRRGLLQGGKVTEPRDAVFSGSLQKNKQIFESGVQMGSRATFFLVVPYDMSGFSQVITSPLVKIRIERGQQAPAQ